VADGQPETGDGAGALTDPRSTAPPPLTAPPPFGDFYRRYVAPVYSYIYSRVGNRSDAEDLTEQTFVEAWQGMARYEEQGKAAAWLFTIARRRIIDHYRTNRHELSFDEGLDSRLDLPGPEAELLQQERLAQLSALLLALDDEKQELLQLRFVAGLSYREIGEVVGSREGAVKVAIYRLLAQLRARWSMAEVLPQEEGSDE
jgi:RNA polymerase sigma-70 factor, ECF subfamily